jgi:hypothetical protein
MIPLILKKAAANLKEKLNAEMPSPYKLADESDQDGWERSTNGLMADAGTSDDAVETKPYEADA